jgi:hypothetical protein
MISTSWSKDAAFVWGFRIPGQGASDVTGVMRQMVRDAGTVR